MLIITTDSKKCKIIKFICSFLLEFGDSKIEVDFTIEQ